MHFIRTFFITLIVLTSILLGFIYSIDPYDKYGINLFGFETKAVAMARENKFNMVEHSRKNYEAFVLGSSSAHRLHTDDVEALTGLKTFNYALQHTTPEDYLAITRHILSKYKPKLILFQMDFYGLNQNFKTDTRFYTSPLKNYLKDEKQTKAAHSSWIDSDYLTLGAISDSFKVVWVNLAGKVKHLYLEDGNYQKENAHIGPIQVTQYSYTDYTISNERVQLLAKIKQLCDLNNVRLIVWSSPYSYEHVRRIFADPQLNKELQKYKNSLKLIFGQVHDFTNLEVRPYDSGAYFQDSSHPTRELFGLILQTVLGPNDQTGQFGKLI